MRKFFRRFLSSLLCPAILAGLFCLPGAADAGDLPTLSADCAILIDADSGRVIGEKNADERRAMASTTTIMTALVALRTAALDQVVEVSPAAVGVEGSSIYLYAGEKLTMEELLYAMLLESANDAAAAIAVAVSGSIEAFADAMNAEAASMGLSATHFTNPHGLWDADHYTTARELAVITRLALQIPAFREIVSTYRRTIPLNDTEGVRLLLNHNKLLKLYDGTIGVKTGFTQKSGRGLVSAARRDGELTYTIPVTGGTVDYVTATNTLPLAVTLSADAPPPVLTVEFPRLLYAPVDAGATIGRLVWRSGDEIVGESPLTAAFAVEQRPVKQGFWAWLCGLFGK